MALPLLNSKLGIMFQSSHILPFATPRARSGPLVSIGVSTVVGILAGPWRGRRICLHGIIIQHES